MRVARAAETESADELPEGKSDYAYSGRVVYRQPGELPVLEAAEVEHFAIAELDQLVTRERAIACLRRNRG